jgi:hypothetical protein
MRLWHKGEIRGNGQALWYEKERKKRWRPSRDLRFWIVLLLAVLLVAVARTCARGQKIEKAATGFEPVNRGFADPRLGPLGYAAVLIIRLYRRAGDK